MHNTPYATVFELGVLDERLDGWAVFIVNVNASVIHMSLLLACALAESGKEWYAMVLTIGAEFANERAASERAMRFHMT
jgi:hypothetical protein